MPKERSQTPTITSHTLAARLLAGPDVDVMFDNISDSGAVWDVGGFWATERGVFLERVYPNADTRKGSGKTA